MSSNDEWFFDAPGITIYNDRNQKDIASVDDNEFSGIS